MNERIRELAEQAFLFASETDDSDESDANWWNAYNERFAELIVRECAEICLEDNDHKNILRHFGVE